MRLQQARSFDESSYLCVFEYYHKGKIKMTKTRIKTIFKSTGFWDIDEWHEAENYYKKEYPDLDEEQIRNLLCIEKVLNAIYIGRENTPQRLNYYTRSLVPFDRGKLKCTSKMYIKNEYNSLGISEKGDN